MSDTKESQRAGQILKRLKKAYPKVESALEYQSPFELLISTILSAQCTDQRVNIVTKTLFKKYKKPNDYIIVSDEELRKDIYSTGFYKQKTKSIKNCCVALMRDHNCKVPSDFDGLVKLPGVGRKTASVVAGNAFGIPAVSVDTHVKRLSNLLGFVKSNNVEKIEERLKELFLKEDWIKAGYIPERNIPKIMKHIKNHPCQSLKRYKTENSFVVKFAK